MSVNNYIVLKPTHFPMVLSLSKYFTFIKNYPIFILTVYYYQNNVSLLYLHIVVNSSVVVNRSEKIFFEQNKWK